MTTLGQATPPPFPLHATTPPTNAMNKRPKLGVPTALLVMLTGLVELKLRVGGTTVPLGLVVRTAVRAILPVKAIECGRETYKWPTHRTRQLETLPRFTN